MGDEVENQREHDAGQDAGDYGEEYRDMLAAVGDVTGKAAERKADARGQHDDRANNDDHESEPDDGFADVEHG